MTKITQQEKGAVFLIHSWWQVPSFIDTRIHWADIARLLLIFLFSRKLSVKFVFWFSLTKEMPFTHRIVLYFIFTIPGFSSCSLGFTAVERQGATSSSKPVFWWFCQWWVIVGGERWTFGDHRLCSCLMSSQPSSWASNLLYYRSS